MLCVRISPVFVAFVTWSMVYHVTDAQPADSSQVCLIVPPDVEDCYRSFVDKPISSRAAQVSCLQKLLWNFQPDNNMTTEDTAMITQLMDRVAANAPTGAFAMDATGRAGPTGRTSQRSPSGYRTRREYRTMSRRERNRFHDAMQRLYNTGVIRAFARIHTQAVQNHHGGVSFLPWHRVYLVMFEEQLRRIDDRIFLPYWDSTIDDAMGNGVNSVLWSPEYFGNGAGDVTTGFAAGWVSAQGNLERDYGRNSRLMRKSDIRQLLTRCNLRDIAGPLEGFHGGPHVWVGGDMGFATTAGYEPIFYMHHAYIDYIWEVFRRRQRRRCRVDPANDYPDTPTGSPHGRSERMTGFPTYTNGDGILDYWIENWYGYASAPRCPNCCPGCGRRAPMYCDRRRRVCVARSRRRSTTTSATVGRTGPLGALAGDIAAGISTSFFEPSEQRALDTPPMPRNRGAPFPAPPGDRTLATAEQDAAAAEAEAGSTLTSGMGDRAFATGDRAFPTGDRVSPTGERTFPRTSRLPLGRSGRSRTFDLGSFTGSDPSPRFRSGRFAAPSRTFKK